MQGFPSKPRVFISHSTHAEDPRAVYFLERLHQTLLDVKNSNGTSAFDVLLDKTNLHAGEKWREVIREWVLDCDAAIVLLSDAATRSDYVKLELTLLQERMMCESSDLMLIPICFPSVTDQDLIERMGPQQITERQMRRLNENNDNQILDELVSHLRLLPQRVARHPIEDHLFSFFCFSFLDEELKHISDALALSTMVVSARKERAQRVVRSLLGSEGEPVASRWQRLRVLLDKLRIKKLDQCQRSLLLDWVFPFCWVNTEAALKLPNIAARTPSTRAVAWGREWVLSEQMYLLRGFCHPNVRTIYVSNLDGGVSQHSGDVNSFLNHIASCLYQEFFHRMPKDSFEDVKRKVCQLVDEREQDGEPVFLIIPLEAVSKERVQLILQEFPKLTLFLYAETLTQKDFDDLEFPSTDFLAPPLDIDVERRAYAEYGRLLTLIGEPLDKLDRQLNLIR